MKSIVLGIFIASSTWLMADGSSISITPREIRASTDQISASIRRDRIEARIGRNSHGGSKVKVNKNRNLGIVNKSKINASTVGMSIQAE